MNDATKRVAEGWGFDCNVIEELDEDVEISVLTLLLVIELANKVDVLDRKVGKLMADVTALEAAINSLTAADESVATALTDLRDEVASLEAGTITQETIDSLTSKVTNAVTALGNAVAPPAEPPAEETPAAEA